MAVMYPTDIENYNYTLSEKYMYESFRDQLPEKYHVFYSVRWFEMQDGKRVDSESDFIVFDPSFGFITIEVKGGKNIMQNSGNWFLTENENGEESIRQLKCSPYEQAEKSMRHFFNYFHDEFHQSFNGAYGFAVALPWYSCESIISSSSPREVTIDMSDMSNLKNKINAIFHYWKNKRNLSIPFSAEQRKRFISLINKRISLSAAAGALIPIKEKELMKINAIQDSILDAVCNYKELQFVGGAGTGKTFIGAKKAVQEAECGKSVLFTCCSKPLTEYVKTELLEKHPEIECLDFDSLMRKELANLYDEAQNGGELLIDYMDSIPENAKFDCIIVDEAQDFDVDMGLSIRALLKKNYTTFYVFFDENQNVFARDFKNSFEIEYPPIILRYNIRNTGRIYENAISRTGLGRETVSNTLLGIEPEYFSYTNATQGRKALTNIINRLTQKEGVSPKSIVVLSNWDYDESILCNEEYIGALFIDRRESKGTFQAASIRFSNVRSFKGMESDVVIYINHEKKGKQVGQHDLCEEYVALTRARYYLYVLNITL